MWVQVASNIMYFVLGDASMGQNFINDFRIPHSVWQQVMDVSLVSLFSLSLFTYLKGRVKFNLLIHCQEGHSGQFWTRLAPKHLNHLFITFPDRLAGSCVCSGVAGAWTSILMCNAGIKSDNPLCHNMGRFSVMDEVEASVNILLLTLRALD